MDALEEAHKRFNEIAQGIQDSKENALRALNDYEKAMQDLLDAITAWAKPITNA